jgi:hypothetical protein
MSKPNISQLIEEARQSLREIATLAAKPGKDQSINQHRMALREGIQDVLEWCRDNADEIREYRNAKGQGE